METIWISTFLLAPVFFLPYTILIKKKVIIKKLKGEGREEGYCNMNWIKTAVLMGAVTLVLLVAGVRKLDREEEGKRKSGSRDKEPVTP
jgi:hypothetical protein